MKNVQAHYTPEEIHRYFQEHVWETEFFKQEHLREGSFLNRIMNRLAEYPIFTYEMSDNDNERAQFSAWWRGLSHRDYGDNHVLHDLYWFHELYHAASMPYARDMGFQPPLKGESRPEGATDLRTIIGRNETEASITSEILVYLHYPELRKYSFPNDPILADRFLQDQAFMDQWNAALKKLPQYDADYKALVAQVRKTHSSVQHGHPDEATKAWLEDPLFPRRLEIRDWVMGFNDQNRAWMKAWQSRYAMLEDQLVTLKERIDRGEDRKQAMDDYMVWLKSPEITDGTMHLEDGKEVCIPFFKEAKEFALAYFSRKDAHYKFRNRIAHEDYRFGFENPEFGVFISQFQPPHIGHQATIDQILADGKNVVVVIGSAQQETPLSAEQRMEIIRTAYKGILRDKPEQDADGNLLKPNLVFVKSFDTLTKQLMDFTAEQRLPTWATWIVQDLIKIGIKDRCTIYFPPKATDAVNYPSDLREGEQALPYIRIFERLKPELAIGVKMLDPVQDPGNLYDDLSVNRDKLLCPQLLMKFLEENKAAAKTILR